MENALNDYQYLSSKTLVLPTELLQVGFFRNTEEQGQKIIQHSLTKNKYQLNSLYCDTTIDTLLFSYTLISHQANALDKCSDMSRSFEPYGRGSKLLKYLKQKGNYTISEIEQKLFQFEEKFIKEPFYVNDEPIYIFKILSVDPDDKQLFFEFSKKFIDYLNQKKYSLTFVQITDFLAVKRKNQTPLFLIFQSMRGINSAFLTKRYISDILGITKDVNKKLSIAMKSLSSKNAIDYTKEVCITSNSQRKFSRFIINSFDPDFASKKQDCQPYTPISKTLNRSDKKPQEQGKTLPSFPQLKALDNQPAEPHSTKNNVVDFFAFKAKKEQEKKLKARNTIEVDEIDYAFLSAFLGDSDYWFKCEKGKVSICTTSEKDATFIQINPENMSALKIKTFDF
ncbi:hypothetical protein MACH16_04730 [Marinomonas pontica]|uniref:Replication initiation protein n=1 Tax=Marinomonas pontica TaxID=264739 RepID=A0ABM8FC06_9GAMM|nr:hypothetical protein MACH16_04730 [Marinomonas pontica]